MKTCFKRTYFGMGKTFDFKYYKKVFDMVERMWKIESINKLFFKTYYFQSINKECTRVFNELTLFI